MNNDPIDELFKNLQKTELQLDGEEFVASTMARVALEQEVKSRNGIIWALTLVMAALAVYLLPLQILVAQLGALTLQFSSYLTDPANLPVLVVLAVTAAFSSISLAEIG
jgi:hypothetical protein